MIDLRAQEWWTRADAAELDALVYALAAGAETHRQLCRACRPEPCPRYEAWLDHEAECKPCQGDAPLTYGPPCPERRRFLDEHDDCVRCLPCPHLRAAIEVVVDWRARRILISRAKWERTRQSLIELEREFDELLAAEQPA